MDFEMRLQLFEGGRRREWNAFTSTISKIEEGEIASSDINDKRKTKTTKKINRNKAANAETTSREKYPLKISFVWR